jgi:hypothetical protein
VSSNSVLQALDFALMGTLEARKGPWGGLLDLQYVKLGVSNQFAGLGGYNVEYEQTIATVAGFYRVASAPVAVDLLAGVRYVNAMTHVDIAPSLRGFGRRVDGSDGSTNGILGVRRAALRPAPT